MHDDGKWLLEAHEHLDDPDKICTTEQRFQQLLREDEKNFLKPPERMHALASSKEINKEKNIENEICCNKYFIPKFPHFTPSSAFLHFIHSLRSSRSGCSFDFYRSFGASL
jgi:hypothetical protein